MQNKDCQKLRECPFCGGEAEVTTRDVEPQGDPWYGQNIQTFVICTNCGACLFDDYFHEGFADEHEAIAAWNRRADARSLAAKTGVCPMCEDCPDGCPVETPNDSRNKPENEPLTLDELREELGRLEELALATNGDAEETYTNGYRWGYRNGQIEILRRILNIGDGTCESKCSKPERSEQE